MATEMKLFDGSLIQLLIDNKELIMQLYEFIKSFFPPAAQAVAFDMSAETKFVELAAACKAEGFTLDQLHSEIAKALCPKDV